ncbi:MAG: hypothetical protein II966_04585 [Lachnospiraceae bacterium]|nr:hypothetical protein [Lachnospiraceae bacterium]
MRRWCIGFITTFIILLLVFGGLTVVIDPFFHFHKPLKALGYRMTDRDERYLNDGILRHFDYDSIITGTSMTQNFKSSEFDELFGVNSVKVPLSGASYKETDEQLKRAFARHSGIKTVLRGLDYGIMAADPDEMMSDDYPTYLYDDDILNDAEYIFNKEIFAFGTFENVILYTLRGGKTTTFDEYENWNDRMTFGKEAVLKQYVRGELKPEADIIPFDDRNLRQNVIDTVSENPDTGFLLFFTPSSILMFDGFYREGTLKNHLLWERKAIEELLECENVRLFSFYDDFDLITDLNNYKDVNHYREEVNSYILQSIKKGEHELTRENYGEYCDKVWEFYTGFEYDKIFED